MLLLKVPVHQPVSIGPQSATSSSEVLHLPAGINLHEAQSARKFETEKKTCGEQLRGKIGLFETEETHKKERRSISKSIKIEITQISGNKQQVSHGIDLKQNL